ncbi:hypothetical protein, partial [Leucothrix pacifica]
MARGIKSIELHSDQHVASFFRWLFQLNQSDTGEMIQKAIEQGFIRDISELSWSANGKAINLYPLYTTI